MAVLEKIKMGETREAAILFVERIALGPGTWKRLPLELQETFVFNAITFLDEQNDPDWMMIDLTALSRFPRRVLITKGGQSPPFFDPIVQTLAATLSDARLRTIPDAGHIPQVTHPEQYATLLREFLRST